MQTSVVLLGLGAAIALRLWAIIEIRRLQYCDPQFAKALRHASTLG